MRKGFLAAIVALLATVAGASAGDQIRLKSRQFLPERGISVETKARIERSTGGKAHVIIQLDRKMTRAYRKSLEARGVRLLGYIPERAWFAAVDPDRAEDIAGIAGIRAVCEVLPIDKIAPSIRRGGINAYSTTETGRAKLLVMFFRDVSMTQAKAIIASYGGKVVGQARIITVDDDGPADFATIQAAIDDANDGDTVVVADGTYTGDGNRDIDFHGKAITVKSENGPENCIIDCNGNPAEPHRGFYFHSGERQDSELSGVTITKGYAREGGGIYCKGSNPSIENCVMTRSAAQLGGGIYWEASSSRNAALARCVIMGNSAAISGGGMWFELAGGTVENCLIVGNSAVYDGGGVGVWIGNPLTFDGCTLAGNTGELGGGLWCVVGTVVLRNCILWGDAGSLGPEIMLDNTNTMPPFGNVDIYYCDLEGGPAGVYGYYGWGYGIFFREGNIDADPCFADLGYWTDPCETPSEWWDDVWVDGDYHVKSQGGRWDANEGGTTDEVTSLCIDAGDPTTPIGPEPFPNGGRINMGAYGGTSEASKSYFGAGLCETIMAGDVNGDCRVNFLDFGIMAMHWMEEH